MIDLNKLKTEHARYKEALLSIRVTDGEAGRLIAAEALNPPPPEPVTLKDILSALDRYKTKTDDYVAILFNPDESGGIKVGATEVEIFEFINLRQALDFLTNEN